MSAKELLAKNLTKSHSSSSLLLSSANLSWTQPSNAILVTPQPPIETSLAATDPQTRQQTNDELIESLRLTSSNQSINSLDNFQTINLSDNNTKEENTATNSKPIESVPIQDFSAALEKLSLNESFISNPLTSLFGLSHPENSSIDQTFTPDSNQHLSQLQTTNSVSYSSSDFNLSNQSLNSSSHSISSVPPIVQSLPQTPQQSLSPPLPPKGFVSRDYKIRGPLRLYDPNHGISGTTSQPNQTLDNTQRPQDLAIPPQLNIPYSQPLTTIATESLYNPINYYNNSEPTLPNPPLPNAPTLYEPQQYPTESLSEQTVNSNQFSFISQTNDWTQQQQMGQNSETVTDSYNQYTSSQHNGYQPVIHHWFYQQIVENREIWKPFSLYDSYNLEQSLITSDNYGYGVVIPTDGGRFDVNIYERLRRPVYWSEVPSIVRRCSWFHKKEGHNRFSPYPEDFAAKLEDIYRDSMVHNKWNQRIEFPEHEVVVMHSQQYIYHFQSDHSMPDGWGSSIDNPIRPKHVHRGAHDIFDDIDEGEPQQIDHVVFLIHGIGEMCDFRFRSIVEVVDDFRAISLSLMRTHFKQYLDSGQLGRIELLPISWHSALHGQETGIDDRLKLITLSSIPKLRHFTNDTILDALFYTSPLYCQTIVDNVGSEINRLFDLFCTRNPSFCGTVALGGHSLGALIVFDLLAHQVSDECDISACDLSKTESNDDIKHVFFQSTDNQTIESVLNYLGFTEFLDVFRTQKIDFETLLLLNESDLQTLQLPIGLQKKLLNFIDEYKQNVSNNGRKGNQLLSANREETTHSVNYAFESMGIGFPSIKYPKLNFKPSALFALGSPISMFLTVRGIDSLGADYRLPTCPAVYNIFHPYDPFAYRMEPMIDSSFKDIKPVLIPHHKGRKRMHLELKESITRMGSDLKNKIYDSIKYTWHSINEFARAHKPVVNSGTDDSHNEHIVDQHLNQSLDEEQDSYSYDNLSIGSLNSGRRIDYVLQEKPIEIFNEYLFAMAAHACYWQSEDTALLILRELYGQLGFFSSQTPQLPVLTPSQTTTPSQPYDQQFIEQQFDHQLIHNNFE